MIRLGVLTAVVLSASGVVAQEAINGSHQHPAVRIAQGGGAGHTMGAPAAKGATSNRNALIKDALSAAPPLIAQTATVKDWDGTVLKQGNDHFTCFPTDPASAPRAKRNPCALIRSGWLGATLG